MREGRHNEGSREREWSREKIGHIIFCRHGDGHNTHEIVFFSVVLASGLARLSTFNKSLVLALMRECK